MMFLQNIKMSRFSAFAINIRKNSRYFTQFISGQLMLQVANLLNGFFLLRWLSISQQAKFSVAFSIQSFTISLSDLGFTGSIIALVGTRINDKKVVGTYIETAKKLRNYFFIFSTCITLIIVPFIIKEQSWSHLEMGIIIIPVLLAVYWQANCSLYDSTLVMHKKITELYKPQVGVSILKLATNYLLYIAGYIGALSTLIINAFALFFNGRTYKKKAAPYIEITNDNKDAELKEMIHYLKPLFPSLVFNALYSQFQVFLISFFGKTSNIAEVAALGRLSQMFLFLNSINNVIVAPVIAKSEPNKLAKNYVSVLGFSVFIATCIYISSILFPDAYLWLLGSKYYHLRNELSIMILNACLSYVTGVLWVMHSARRWIFWWGTWSYMVCVITCQIIGLTFFDVSTTAGVLHIGTITLSSMLIVHGVTAFLGFRKLKYAINY